MTTQQAVSVLQQATMTGLLIAGPVLLVSLVVGLLISILQAVTQVNEMTLTFVPKILAAMITIVLLMPWFAEVLVRFFVSVVNSIPEFVH